ncbi:LysM peptidoglycan-binding domain-containing protein [Cellulomonas dongxiuzhuiae]|uniref:LysM peptidoglycan-binding domain-containing protein n=1 Tax=Cellulomonas dongxiuzhuiae TaxID=2819979 RepID=A0ABX8GP51_9CELL|nr:LysM peptidoglycan-binding domain-containing protein [Cellulomonas dongxiuzhuiae]QWC17431.1 LysM peptidoglycan-binding domain-containing protein [Cellulomonas dongxiuzhuiae]
MSAIAIAPALRGTARPRAGAVPLLAAGTGARAAAHRPAGRAGTAASPAPLRLTRRGRAVVWCLGIALAAGVGGAAASAQADGPVAATEVRRVVVAPGDTLWDIAADAASPGQDVRDVVLRLIALNELPSGGLRAGQTIVVPVG